MSESPKIPPVFVEAEKNLPPHIGAGWFHKCPAEEVQPDDLVMLGIDIYRVKDRWNVPGTPKIHFTLWPTDGGRPASESWFPRQWIPTCRIS